MGKSQSVGTYLIKRLEELGIEHVFGVPGDYVLGFYRELCESKIEVIGTCTELGAGFAADAYARVNGLGAACVTYCVGGLNILNAVAGAYAEKSPVIVISGAPGLNERVRSPLLHHRVRDFNTQLQIFQQVTVAAVALEDPEAAPDHIEEALQKCMQFKRPIYFELPRDIAAAPCGPLDMSRRASAPKSDPGPLAEAVEEAAQMLRGAKRPVVLAGVEIHRFGLQDSLIDLVEEGGFPVAATLLGKSVIAENHPQYLGVYEGAMGREDVRVAVERADCVLILGAFMTDINLGIFTSNIDVSRTINATSERVSIQHHHFEGIALKDFITGLGKSELGPKRLSVKPRKRPVAPPKTQPNRALTIRRFFALMNERLKANSLVIADIGDSLFGAADLVIQRHTEFLSPAYYTSMGFGVPAALGAQIGRRHLRPLVFVGDGAFQMTSQELSTIVRNGLNPIIIVLNNKGYTTERFIMDGAFNDIHDWAYHEWPTLLCAGLGFEVRTEGELESALERAFENTGSYSIINAHFDPYDSSPALQRLGMRLGKQLKTRKRVG